MKQEYPYEVIFEIDGGASGLDYNSDEQCYELQHYTHGSFTIGSDRSVFACVGELYTCEDGRQMVSGISACYFVIDGEIWEVGDWFEELKELDFVWGEWNKGRIQRPAKWFPTSYKKIIPRVEQGIGKRIYDWRRERGLSLKDLHAKSGVSYPLLHELETQEGKKITNLNTLEKLANTMQVNPAWLCGWVD